MKPEAQRIAIAEACGLKQPFKIEREWEETGGLDGYDGWFDVLRDAGGAKVPDYISDLNAMHCAEKVLTIEQRSTFCYHLLGDNEQIYERQDCWDCSFSSADQRAEAFLRTIGKWEDDK